MNLIKEDVFRKQMKKGLSGGYLFFGDEDYMKGFALRSARESICSDETFALFNDVRIDAMDYSASALLDAMIPPPMMADKKIVSVSGLNISSLRANEVDDLCEALSALSEYDYNVLILSVPAGQIEEGNPVRKPSAILTRLSEFLTPVYFEPISAARLTGWVEKHFEHHGVSADAAVCGELIRSCGRSMFVLASETEKLAYYVLGSGRTKVTSADVAKVATTELSIDAFALSNAILDGRYEDAMKALEVMKFRRIDPVIVMSEISGTVCDLLAVKSLQMEGASVSEINTLLRLRSEYRARLYMNAATDKSPKKLRRAVELCSEADLLLKQSAQSYVPIERLICSL